MIFWGYLVSGRQSRANAIRHTHRNPFTSTFLDRCSLFFFFVFVGLVGDFNQVLDTAPGLLFASFAARTDGIEKTAVVHLGL